MPATAANLTSADATASANAFPNLGKKSAGFYNKVRQTLVRQGYKVAKFLILLVVSMGFGARGSVLEKLTADRTGTVTILRIMVRVAATVASAHGVGLTAKRAAAVRRSARGVGTLAGPCSAGRATDGVSLGVVVTTLAAASQSVMRATATEPPMLPVPADAKVLTADRRAEQNAVSSLPPTSSGTSNRAKPAATKRFVVTPLLPARQPLVPDRAGTVARTTQTPPRST